MTVAHHVSDRLLVLYAGGNLAEGWSLAVATHLALCPDCRERLAVFECIGGALLDEQVTDDRQSIDASWEAQLARMQAPAKPPASARKHPGGSLRLPQPLFDYVGTDIPDIRWKALGPGAYHFPLAIRDGETNARLLRIPAGKPVPEHGHGGRELTLVLEGAFHDGAHLFRRGDLEEADGDIVHQPTATPEQDCICLAVTDAPLRFSSWVVRMIQPILRI